VHWRRRVTWPVLFTFISGQINYWWHVGTYSVGECSRSCRCLLVSLRVTSCPVVFCVSMFGRDLRATPPRAAGEMKGSLSRRYFERSTSRLHMHFILWGVARTGLATLLAVRGGLFPYSCVVHWVGWREFITSWITLYHVLCFHYCPDRKSHKKAKSILPGIYGN